MDDLYLYDQAQGMAFSLHPPVFFTSLFVLRLRPKLAASSLASKDLPNPNALVAYLILGAEGYFKLVRMLI